MHSTILPCMIRISAIYVLIKWLHLQHSIHIRGYRVYFSVFTCIASSGSCLVMSKWSQVIKNANIFEYCRASSVDMPSVVRREQFHSWVSLVREMKSSAKNL